MADPTASEPEEQPQPLVITLNDILNGVRQDGEEPVIPYEDAFDPEPMDGVVQRGTPEEDGAKRAYESALRDPLSVVDNRQRGHGRNRMPRKSAAEIQAAKDEYRRKAEARGLTLAADGSVVMPGNPEAV